MDDDRRERRSANNLPVLAGQGQPLPGQVSDGAVLAGRYEIREAIGAGGMGVVHRAWDRNRACEVAIKLMHPRLVGSSKAREAFLKEARLSSELSHPGIVNVFDVERDGDVCFLTMELLRGKTLRQELRARAAEGTTLTTDECLRIVLPLCDALHYAHQRTVHRDVKPENVFLTEDGQVKLMDFGIARLIHEDGDSSSGTSVGTAYYAAPEYLKGARSVDHRADQFGLAVMLYEMLTGVVPAGAVDPVRSLRPDVGKHISRVVMRGISPAPQARFADIEVFARRLDSAPAGRSVVLASLLTLPLLALGWQAVAAQEPPRADGGEEVDQLPPIDEGLLNLVEQELNSLVAAADGIRSRAQDASQEEPTIQAGLWLRAAILVEQRFELSDERIEARGFQAYLREVRDRWPDPERATAELRERVAQLRGQRKELVAVLSLVPQLAALLGAGEPVDGVEAAFERGAWTEALQLADDQAQALERRERLRARVEEIELRWEQTSATAAGDDRARAVAWIDQLRREPTEDLLPPLEELLTRFEQEASQRAAAAARPLQELLARFEPLGEEWVSVEGASFPGRVRHLESGLELVLVTGGRFSLGADSGERDELPSTPRDVAPFYLGYSEVPWSIYLRHGGSSAASPSGDDHPAVGMGQEEASAFCAGLGLRLPTETEWEWAAGGPAESTYPWGNTWERGRANGAGTSRPEGARGVEAFAGDLAWCGALHLAGNVAELCAGSYSDDLTWAAELSADQVHRDSSRGPIVRGGSFRTYSRGCRTTSRREGEEGLLDVGFRVAYSPAW